MVKSINYRLRTKLNEVYSVEPADLGVKSLTNLYKKTTSYFKTMPFVWVIPLSFILAFLLYFGSGRSLLIRIVSLLQYGF